MQRVVKYGVIPNGACFILYVSLLIKEGLIYDNEGDINGEPPTNHRRREDPFQTQLNLLHYILRGVKVEEEKMADSNRESLPLSPIIYKKIKAVEYKSL